MKKLLLLSLLACLMVGCKSAPTVTEKPPTASIQTEIYTNDQYGFSINAPTDWEVDTSDERSLVTYINPTSDEEFPSKISVLYQPANGLTLRENTDQFVAGAASTFEGFKLRSRVEGIIQNYATEVLEYEMTLFEDTVIMGQQIIEQPDGWLVITGAARAKDLQPLIAAVKASSDSLQLIERAEAPEVKIEGPEAGLGESSEQVCAAKGGTWHNFPNGCVDRCHPKDLPQICTQAFEYGCDCGTDKCWDGENCVVNPS